MALTLDPVTNWTKMKGANSPSNQGLEDSPSSNSKVTPITGVLQLNKKGCSTSTNPSTENGHDIRTSYTSDQMETVEKTDYERALERIKAVITSNPAKRPTGRVVSIIKRSPRREAVVGFIVPTPLLPEIEFNGKGTDFKLGMRKNKNDTISAIHLVPNDPRLPKMAVNIDNLPDVARERVEKGDVTIKKELIAARIDEWNEESLFPVAQVVDVLGPGCEIETQIAAILFEHAIDTAKFSLDSRSCVPGPSWVIPEEEVTARRDLRNVLTFTIDPASAIDLDDALSIEMVSDGLFRIGVHIADVSYFVRPNSSLDKEAQVRSTSVYMVQHKLSMLPEELSQGCATLSPGLDRLTMSVIWDVDSSGNILDRWIGRSVIFSCCKLSYDLVQDVIDTGFIPYLNGSTIPQVYGKYQWKDVVKSLKSIYNLSQKLNEIRFRDGALSLGNSKLAFLFDEGGLPCDSYRSDERIEACLLVEEFMLLANRSVAEVIASAFPDCALLRRHPLPNLRRLKEFEVFCGRLGIELDASSSGQLHLSLSKIREKLKDDPFLFNIIVSYASKPMQSAMYFCTGDLKGKKDEWGHYALSLPFYTHFTSPIRRYPDIIVHRTLLAVVDAEVCLKRREGTFGNSTSEVRCFTGLNFDRGMAESKEGKDALLGAAIKFRVPGVEVLGELAEYFNERKLASCHAEDAGRKVYLWALLKHKQVLFLFLFYFLYVNKDFLLILSSLPS